MSRRLSLAACVVLSALLVGALIWMCRVTTIYCFVQYANCSPEVTAALKPLRGQRLLISDLEGQVQQLLQSNPDIRISQISKQLPGTVLITLEPQKIAYVFRVAGSDQVAVVTDDGRLVKSDLRSDWPVFEITAEMLQEIVNQPVVVESRHQQLLITLAAVKTLNWQTTFVSLPDWQTVAIEAVGQPTLVLPLDQLTSQLERAKDLWASLPDEQKATVKEVDVRFKLPVLRQTPTIPRHDSL